MKSNKMTKLFQVVMAIAITALIAGCKESQTGSESMNLGIPESILTPDVVETSIGTMKFLDGAPYPETAEMVYDNLDRMRGVDAFLKGIPGASVNKMISGFYSIGAVEAHQVVLFDKMLDPQSLFLTANSSTMYIWPTLDLERDGPTVLEAPPGMLGLADDAWFRYLTDIGPLGPDKGQGGKYLFLPPGYQGDVPDGYFTVQSTSYHVMMLVRTSIANGIEAAAKNVRDNMKVYPLSKASNPPEMEFISGTGKEFNTIHANDFEFYEELNAIIQKEPLDLLDPETRGLFASIGIEKGKPFAPDERMKKILTDAVAIGNATARSIVWYPRPTGTMEGIRLYPESGSAWNTVYLDKNVFFNGQDGKTMNSDARTFFHYIATGITPAMAVSIPGKGSDYGFILVDSENLPFEGDKTYRMRLPANVPVNNFWSVTLYDNQTRSMLRTNQQYPALDSQGDKLKQNADGSIDIYFAPKAPQGMESNWLETIPGKSYWLGYRMYGPLEPWFDKTWRPGEVELVN